LDPQQTNAPFRSTFSALRIKKGRFSQAVETNPDFFLRYCTAKRHELSACLANPQPDVVIGLFNACDLA
jgi:hypothetical protein